MIILDVDIGYDLCGLDCQKKKKKSTSTLGCLSHALDPLGFGASQNLSDLTKNNIKVFQKSPKRN